MPSSGTHNLVFAATEHNSVYAFDADQPALPIWHVNLGPTIPCGCTGGNMYPEEGITATPVIDPTSGTIFVINTTINNGAVNHMLHALNVTSGAEKFGGPVRIQGSVAGTASGGTTVAYQETYERLRPALSLVNGNVIFGTASYGDNPPYHGWIFSYSAGTLAQTGIWNSTPNGGAGSFWQSGAGFVADAQGNIYGMAANGDFDGLQNFGDSFVRLSTGTALTLKDYFAPSNQLYLDQEDYDLGSSGPMAIPGTTYVIGAGKAGVLYVVNGQGMGGFSASGPDQIVQELLVTPGLDQLFGHEVHGVPTYWNGPSGQLVYIWGANDALKAWKFNGSLFSTTPFSTSQAISPAVAPQGNPGGFLSVSANGRATGSGIVWASTPYYGDAEYTTVPGIVRAFDASNLSNELWNSKINVARDDVGNFAKFVPPTVANGKVYMATFSNQLVVYGLLAQGFTVTSSAPSLQVVPGSSATLGLSVTTNDSFSGAVSLRAQSLPTGVTDSFAPPSMSGNGSSVLTVSAAATAPPGTYSVNLQGASGTVTQNVPITLNIVNLTLTTPANLLSSLVGGTVNFPITITQSNSTAAAVLSATGLPAGITPSFSPNIVLGSGISNLSVAASGLVSGGNYPFLVTVVSGTTKQTLSLTLSLTDFVLTATPSLITVQAGATATYTVALTPLNGFNLPVSFSYPNNSPGTLTPSTLSGSGSVTAAIHVPGGVPPGSYPVYVSGTSGSVVRQTAFWVTVPATSFTPIRVNSGGPTYVDSYKNTWVADSFVGQGTAGVAFGTVNGTNDPALYQTYRTGAFEYQIPVPDGNYLITLKFAEPNPQQVPGGRLFDVSINGQLALQGFDIVAQADGPLIALDRQFLVSSKSSPINILFAPGSADTDQAVVSAIEVASQVGVTVAVSPAFVSVGGPSSQQFTATVNGTTNNAVYWSVSPPIGTITSGGLYTPPSGSFLPQVINVTARSVANPTRIGTANLAISPVP